MSIVKSTSRKNVILFSFYDIANTVYSQIIQSTIILRYIQLIGQKEYGLSYENANFVFSIVQAASQILVIAIIPLIGAMADRMGRKKPFVITITGVTLLTTCLFWLRKNLALVMTLFIVANLAYWAALSAYDAMIPALAKEEDIGKTSGLAMGLGWISILPAIGLTIFMATVYGNPIVNPDAINPETGLAYGLEGLNYGYYEQPLTYILTAVMFLLFMIPFFFSKEKIREGEMPGFKVLLNDSFGQLYRTFRDIRKHKEMFKFIIGYFFIVDVANTANLVLLQVLVDGTGIPEDNSLFLQLPIVFLAIFIIPVIGWLGDRIGPKATIWSVSGLYVVGLVSGICAIWFRDPINGIQIGFNLLFVLTIIMMIGAGVGLGSTWVIQRVMILKLAPPDKVGEYVGFSYIAGRLNASAAFFVWGALVNFLWNIFNNKTIIVGSVEARLGHRTFSIAMMYLLLMLGIGVIITSLVKMPTDKERKQWAKTYLDEGMKTQTEKEKEGLI